MKSRIFILTLLIIFLSAGTGVYICLMNAPGEEEYMLSALAYLEEQKAALSGAETVPIEINWQANRVIRVHANSPYAFFSGTETSPIKIDPQTGRMISMHADSPYTIDKVITWITKATQVQRVKAIPELASPHIYVGDKMTGNNEKLYYTKGSKILEFSLGKTDSLGFLLSICGECGATYPEVKETFSEGVIRQLQEEIVYGDQDIVTFSNGYLEAIDIKTPETAEMLFACIRNCAHITDLTDADLLPMDLPIEINGQGHGTFDMFFATYQETGQFICISFSPEDSERFYQYVME